TLYGDAGYTLDPFIGENSIFALLGYSSGGDDRLVGGDGNDRLTGGVGQDYLEGGAGDDQLFGDSDGPQDSGNLLWIPGEFHADDVLDGGAGNDVLYGDGGNDTLIGGSGADQLLGGAGDDNYLFATGDGLQTDAGVDTITDTQGNNTLVLQGVSLNDVHISQVEATPNALTITYGPQQAGNTLIVKDALQGQSLQWLEMEGQKISFKDYVSSHLMSAVALASTADHQSLLGGTGADRMTQTNNNGVISAGQGSDSITLQGTGNTVQIGAGDGQDSIAGPAALGQGGGNSIEFGPGIALGDISVQRSASGTLVLQGADKNAGVELLGGGIGQIRFADSAEALGLATLVQASLDAQVSTGSDWIDGSLLADVLRGGAGNDVLVGYEGDDTLIADGGDDTLWGGAGNDTYVIGSDAGQVTLLGGQSNQDEGADTVLLSGAKSTSSWRAVRSGSDLMLNVQAQGAATAVSVRMSGFFDVASGSAYSWQNSTVRFSDGAEISRSELLESITQGTDGDDVFEGSSGDEVFNGGAGNDILRGGPGRDLLAGGAGDDLYIFDSTDAVSGAIADLDVITDTEGADVIRLTGGIALADLQAQRLGDGSISLLWSSGAVVVNGGADAAARIQVDVDGLQHALGNFLTAPLALPTDTAQTTAQANADFLASHEQMAREQISYAGRVGALQWRPDYASSLANSVYANNTYSSEIQADFPSFQGLPAWQYSAIQTDAGDSDVSAPEISITRQPVYETTTMYRDNQGNVFDTPYVTVPGSPGGVLGEVEVTADLSYQLQAMGIFVPDVGVDANGNFYKTHNTISVRLSGGNASTATTTYRRADLTAFTVSNLVGYTDSASIARLAPTVDASLGGSGNSFTFSSGAVNGGDGDDVIRANMGGFSRTITPNDYSGGRIWDVVMILGAVAPDALTVRNQVLLTGQTTATWIDGGAGNDTIMGSEVADVLYGGTGFDALDGGAGPDRYLVLDQGADAPGFVYISDSTVSYSLWRNGYGGKADEVLPDGADIDTIEFGPGIHLADLQFSINRPESDAQYFAPGVGQQGYWDSARAVSVEPGMRPYLVVEKGGHRLAAIELAGPDQSDLSPDDSPNRGIEFLEFQDGQRIAMADALALAALPVNHAPVAAMPLPDQAALEGGLLSFSLPQGAFTDADPGDTLAYSVLLADGSALPTWLNFNPSTQTFTGTPLSTELGTLNLVVTATDAAGASASASFSVTVTAPTGPDPLAGNDTLSADTLNTPLHGGAGSDTLTGSWASSTLYGDSGNDVLMAWGGPNNLLDGGDGDDTLTGGWGQDTLIGGEGNNTLIAVGGNSIISAGSGNDLITSNWGDDQINAGAGHDIISTGWGADVINAGAGDDLIRAGGGGDTVRGGLGNDTIINDQWSNDTYLFAAGDGQDTLTDAGGQDQLVLENIDSSQLWFTHTGNDLNINVIGTTDSITLKDWYTGYQYPGSPYHMETIKTSDGKTLLDSQVQNLVDAMAAFAPPAAGQTTLSSSYANSLAPVLAANWQ
ncbi:putative Ig domain-containing protein, partial [Rhodoferax sp.]|uniref:putative Ig domain-containing protein n=1 Tax=Rhodoferax sp. TaxID=50421 RepID=UPI00261033E8